MQDNNDTLTIKSTLTKIGKKRSAQGKLDISKVAFADDGVNYNLINDNLSDPSILVKRQPLFDVWADTHSVLKNKILMEKPDEWKPNNREFGASITRMDEDVQTRVANKGELQVPTEDSTNGFRDIKYYGTDSSELSRQVDIALEFSHSEIFGNDVDEGGYLTVTLHDSSHFDITLTPDNIAKYSRLPDPRTISGFRNTDSARELMKDPWNRAVNALMRGEEPTTGVVDKHVLERNFEESLLFGVNDTESTPRVVNVFVTPDDEGNSLFLRYRGNYNYKDPQVGNYQTFLSIMDERTGQTEYIKLSIISENKPTS